MVLRVLTSAASLLALAGCAAQTVLVGDTRSFVTSANAAGDKAAAFFAEARRRQLEANVLLVASDPSCRWGPYLYLRLDPGPAGGLCASGPAADGSTFRYPLRPISAEAGAPAAQLIAALGAYVGELAKLDDAYVPEFQQTVDDVKARLSKLEDVLGGLGALDPKGLGAAGAALKAAGARYAAPADAVAGLLDFFGGLAKDTTDAAAIRKYVEGNGDRFEAAADALAVGMQAWNVGVATTASQVAYDSLVVGTNRALGETADFERRRALLTQLVRAVQDRQAGDAGFDAAARLLSDLKAQHAALRAFAAGKPSPADRARIAKVQEEQAWQFLGRVGDLASAVGGVV